MSKMAELAVAVDQAGQLNPIEDAETRSERNLRLWRLNETTDPDKTKPVTVGRRFTAIDAYYQIKRATETFGPIGDGWGWDLEEETVSVDGPNGSVHFAKCKVTLWYREERDGEVVRCGPVIGMNQLLSSKGNPDDEAFKKATTDGITKALSYLGFSADVFMGLYDDSKYVNRLKEEMNSKTEKVMAKLPELCTKSVELLPKVMDLAELNVVWKSMKDDLRKLQPAQLDYMKARFAMRKRQLGGATPEDGSDPDQQ